MQKVEINGEEVEVYTAAERDADIAAAKAAVEGEYKPKLTAAETESKRLEGLLEVRAGEFGEMRKLSEEQLSKLTAAERINYENVMLLAAEREKNSKADKAAYEATVTATIRGKVGNDPKLFEEARKMYDLIGLEDITPEGVGRRADAAIGALGRIEPDLLAAAGMGGGDFKPPVQGDGGKTSFADSEAGKVMANELGIQTEYTAEQKKVLGIT